MTPVSQGHGAKTKIAVAARSFARNAALRAELSARYANVTFSESPAILGGDELVALLRGHDRAIIGLERVDDSVLSQLPELAIISKYGVGLDGLDIDAIGRRGIKLGWTGGVNRRSVAELTLSFAVALLHRVPETAFALRTGAWQKLVGRQLTGRTVGIIGCGFVGQDLVKLLAPFGCRVLAHDIRDYADFYRDHQVTPVSLTQLLQESDVVSLHVPLDASTRGMIGAAELAQMRQGSFIINAARGGLIDEDALAGALERGQLAGAACDVYAIEPDAHPRLLGLPTFLGTPHIGGSTQEAQLAMGRAAIEGLEHNRVPGDGWPA
ncbi:MAG TPA: phosphoglycerate dehydrogenase [Vicinamibacterales bacterium]|nr:phosphoglycerate dehydrogenase [Vicinamibacterales bacterium]